MMKHAPYIGKDMAVFDSLGYALFLRDGGVPQEQAETQAEAAPRFSMADLVTKGDLDVQTHRITVRLAAMLVAGFGIMSAIIGLLLRFH